LRGSKLIGWIALVLALGFGFYGTAFWLLRDRGPPLSAFEMAAAQLREAFEPGDLILLVPAYATRAREYLGDLNPVAARRPLAEDLRRHPRFWIFGLFERGDALRPDLLAAGHELLESRTHSGITVDLYRSAAVERVVFDFASSIKAARVFHQYADGRLEACDKYSDRTRQGGMAGMWTCPHDGEWFYVAPEWHRMGDVFRVCLWAHPPTDGRLLIRYPGVPLPARLRGFAGHTLNGSLYGRERIDLDVEVDRVGVQRFVFPLEEHWRPFALELPGTGTTTVSFAISTPDAGSNHFCFTADLRAPGAE
jgi:hypothetical protein